MASPSAARRLNAFELAAADGEQDAAQPALAVPGPGVDRDRAADAHRAAGLVDVSVQAGERLMGLDRVTHGRRAGGYRELVAHRRLDRQLGVELRRRVERR